MSPNPTTEALRTAMRTSIELTELQHTVAQLRLLAALLAGSMIFGLLDPAILLLAQTDSALYRVACATSIGAHALALLFVGLAVALTPFLAVQFGAWRRSRRAVVKVTCLVLVLVALVWMFLSWRSSHLQLGVAVEIVFGRNALGALLFAVGLAFSLNAELLRNAMERPAS